jgi:heme/copper-type cytochrome/quinol oxidase subunit 2
VVQFISAVIGLVALGFLAGLVESTNPPWPDGLTQTVLLLLFCIGLFIGGTSIVRRHNQAGGASRARAQAPGNRTVVIILSAIIVILIGLLVVVIAMSGVLDTDEEQAAVSTSPAPTSTLAARSQGAEPAPTVPPEPTVEPEPMATEEEPSEPRAVVTNDTLNIRTGPGTGYPVVGSLKRGDEVTVTGRNKAGTWLAITTDGGLEGWVYAEYATVNTAVESLPVAQAPPPPASPTPSAPKPTLSVDEQIAKVAGDDHGTLPQPGEVGGVDAGGQAEVTILNDTPYVLTVLIGSPNSIKVTVEACPSCKVYSVVGPLFCQEEGRPKKTIRLAPGSMKVVARVNDPGVIPFYGTWELNANTAYFNCFYIVRSMR